MQFITPTQEEIQIFITTPSQFIVQHQAALLPHWDVPITHIVLFLQQSKISLKESTEQVIEEKDRLRERFIRYGCSAIFALQDQGYPSDLFDPRNGYPLLSQPGNLSLDDNAVVKASLNYPVSTYNNCSLIIHPIWGDRVYPSTLVTSAFQDIIEPLIKELLIGEGLNLQSR